MKDFHFLRPELLLLLIPLFGLAFFLTRKKNSSYVWNTFCSKDLLPYILSNKNKNMALPLVFIFSTLGLLTIALAGPAWNQVAQPLIKSQSGLVIVLDLSPAMNASDIKPSRLQRAIFKINDLLQMRSEGQTSLVVFSDDPFTVTPLTDDIKTIQALLPALDTSIMPVSGHNLHKAVEHAAKLLTQGGISNGSILVITPELTKSDMEKAIAIAKEEKVNVSVLGVGTKEGSPIPKQSGGLMTNAKGALIISKLAEANLKELSFATGGNYARMGVDDEDVQLLSSHFIKTEQTHPSNLSDLKQIKWHDQGYWFVIFALPFFSQIFRKGVLVLFLFFIPFNLQAFSWNDLWKTQNQQASECFQKEEYQKAAELFNHPEWQAASYYKLNDFESAEEIYKTNQNADGLYNLGTTLAKQGKFQEALAAYNKTLESHPEHEDAQFNKKLIEDFLKQQKQEDQKKEKNKDKDKDKDKNQQKKQDSKEKQTEKSDEEDNKNAQDGQDQKKDEMQNENQASENESEGQDGEQLEEKDQEELQKQYKDLIEKELEKAEDHPNAPEASEKENQEKQQSQMDDLWLQRVKDDPGGLLRRKFLLQYQNGNKRDNK